MNKLKSLISVLIILSIMISLSACGQIMVIDDGTTAPESTTPAPVPEQTDVAVTPIPAVSEETPEPAVKAPTDEPIDVLISEIMPANKSCIMSPAGKFSDWVELYNYGSSVADLSDYGFISGGDFVPLTGISIAPGEYKLIYCSSTVSDDGAYADISLSKSSCELRLVGKYGTVFDSITVNDAENDCSYYANDEGVTTCCSFPSPGFANSTEGYESFQATLTVSSPLIISEAMAYNNAYNMYAGEYYDWIELKNTGSEDINLSAYTLADKRSELASSPLPDYTLKAGAFVFVYCSGTEGLSFTNGINAPFALSADRDSIFLGTADGTVIDYLSVHDIPYGGSIGRMEGKNGSFYFKTPTPGSKNSDGYRSYAETPVLLGSDGVFNGVDSVTVELSAPGTIYYTTNGSAPTTSSNRYTGPITLTSTTAFRAIAYEDGRLPSKCLNTSFIINENHTLPVVSIMTENDAMFGNGGVYTNPQRELECVGAVTFYEQEGSFSIECGMKLHGETSKMAQSKKSFKLTFRSRYAGALEYDLFNNGVTEFSSILVRAAQEDYYSTLMRDTLMHQLAIETFPELPAMANKYSVLYINGQYWGVYDLREAHSAAHYANHYGYDEDTVEQWKGQWPSDSNAAKLYSFIMNNNMSDPDNYAYVCEHLNIDSVIGWAIIQAYSGNFDLNASNMRFYYSTEDDKLTFALVDLDLGFFSYNMFDLVFNPDEVYAYNRLAKALLANEDFRTNLLEQLSYALTGNLSNEHVLARIDAIEAELTPEISRDRDRWGGSLEKWQYMVEDLRIYVNHDVGRASLLVTSIKNKLNLSQDTVNFYFSEVKKSEH